MPKAKTMEIITLYRVQKTDGDRRITGSIYFFSALSRLSPVERVALGLGGK